MESDQLSIKIVNDIPTADQTATLHKGSELMVDSTTAMALVFSGAAIQLPT